MVITEQLESLILKHKLDRAYPRFRSYVKCKKIVKKLFSAYAEKDKVLLLSSELDSLSFALQEMEVKCDLEKQTVDVLNFEKLNLMNFKLYSDVIVVSHDFYKEISYELSLRKVKHKCLYDYFTINGLFLDYNYYNIFGGKYMPLFSTVDGTTYSFNAINLSYELFYCYKKYMFSSEKELKEFYLQKVIFLSLYMRDFIATEIHINEYISGKYANYKRYKIFLQSVKELLDDIKLKLAARKDDYLAFLNDALEYGNKEYTPFLNDISKKSLHFENAWTHTPFTTPSIKALMTGKLLIDDRSFEVPFKNNNIVEHLCKERNIQFKYLRDRGFEKNENDCITWAMPASKIYWLAIEYLLNSKKQKFVFMHCLIETHPSYNASNHINLENIICTAYSHIRDKSQRELSIAYADKQLQWYNQFFSENSTKIYMSDHGSGNIPFSCHARLYVNAPWIKPRIVNKFFSFMSFHKLVNMLFDKNFKNLEFLFSNDYIKIQDLPVYDKLAKLSYGNSLHHNLFGYRGVVTKQAYYIKYGDGYEFYQNLEISKHRFSSKDLDYLRSLAGSNFLDPNKEEKLKLSRHNFESLEKYNKRNRLYEKRKAYIFANLFTTISPKKIIAIRGGGMAGVQLLLKLGVEQSQRISFIIDKNPECAAAYFGIPIISPQKAKKTNIDIIIVSLNQDRLDEQLKKELLDFSKTSSVINIYKLLAGKGVVCTRNFWEREIIQKDIV